MGEWQGTRVRGKGNVSSSGRTGREQAFQSCCRYLMKAQAAITVRANTGSSTRAVGMPLGSPSLRCPIGPFCTCNWKGEKNVISSEQCVFTPAEVSRLHITWVQTTQSCNLQALSSRRSPLCSQLIHQCHQLPGKKLDGEAFNLAVLLTQRDPRVRDNLFLFLYCLHQALCVSYQENEDRK